MKRLLALGAAVAMVAVAFVIRSTVAGDGGESPADPGSTTSTDDRPSEPVDTSLTVACIEELQRACESAGLRGSMSFADAFTELTTVADPAIDAWVTVDPWPQIVDGVRAENGLSPIMGPAIETLGSTRFRSYGWVDLVTSSPCAEDGAVLITCLTTDSTIGRSIGIRDPQRSATGAHALVHVAAQFGSTSSASELEALGLTPQTGSYVSPLDAMTLVGQGAFTLTVDLESEAQAVLAGTRIEQQVEDPLVQSTGTAVVARFVEVGDRADDDEVEELIDTLAPAVAAAGWAGDGGADSPDGATVQEFRSLWEQIAR